MTTPAGHLSLPLSLLRTRLSKLAAFQTWTSTADAAAALARIHVCTFPVATATYPLALVDWALNWARNRQGVTNGAPWHGEGDLLLYFSETVSEADDADAAFSFTNSLGAILAELEAVDSDDNLNLQRVQLEGLQRPTQEGTDVLGDKYEAWFLVGFRRARV